MVEIWKDIEGYEGFYQVSSFGNIHSLTRKIKDKNGFNRTIEGRLMKTQFSNQGYVR